MTAEGKKRGRDVVKMMMKTQGAAAANNGPLGTLLNYKEEWV